MELLYRDAEILSSFAWLYGGPRTQDRLNEGWKVVMLNQFHDTLPGTHVPEAVPDIKRDYETAFAIGQEVCGRAISYLVGQLDQTAAVNNDLLLFNTLSWQRNALVEMTVPHDGAVRIGGELQAVQAYNGRFYLHASNLPSLGWTVAAFEEEKPAVKDTATFIDNIIETPLYRIKLGDDGSLAQIYDKINDRDVLAAPGNMLQVFEDYPGYKFSAWDIAYHFEEYQYPVQQTSPWQMVANGPLFAVFSSQWQVLDSTIEQEMWLYTNNPRIDFHTQAEWRDGRKMLKAAFPLQIRTRTATYDLPFGHIERATHRNTGWEQAKFEVCGHKWADMSEGNYGVALLNDCKYGYDAKENVLRLSLLRSPVRPDGGSDIGHHQFTYSLLPHAGGWRQAQVDRHAYELNVPVMAVAIEQKNDNSQGMMPATQSLLDIESDSLIVEALKQAEDDNGLILRTFDSHGNHSKTPFSFGVNIAGAAETDLLEENAQEVTLTDSRRITVQYTPLEIKTHRLNFKI